MCNLTCSAAARIYEMSGSFVLRNGVGTQMITASVSARWEKSVAADSRPRSTNAPTISVKQGADGRIAYAADWFFECPDFFPLPVDGNAANGCESDTTAGVEPRSACSHWPGRISRLSMSSAGTSRMLTRGRGSVRVFRFDPLLGPIPFHLSSFLSS